MKSNDSTVQARRSMLHLDKEPKATAGRSNVFVNDVGSVVYLGALTCVCLSRRSCTLSPIISLHNTQPTTFTCPPDLLQVCKALNNVRTYRIQVVWFVLGYHQQDLQSAVRARPPVPPGTPTEVGLHLSPSARRPETGMFDLLDFCRSVGPKSAESQGRTECVQTNNRFTCLQNDGAVSSCAWDQANENPPTQTGGRGLDLVT